MLFDAAKHERKPWHDEGRWVRREQTRPALFFAGIDDFCEHADMDGILTPPPRGATGVCSFGSKQKLLRGAATSAGRRAQPDTGTR